MRISMLIILLFVRSVSAQQQAPQKTAAPPAAKEQPAAEQPAAPDWTVPVTAVVGGSVKTVSGEKSFPFEEYWDIPEGAFIRRFDFSILKLGNPLRFDFWSVDLVQKDQEASALLEDWGRYRLQGSFWGFQRFWSNENPTVPTEISRGVFVVPAGLRLSLEQAPDPTALARNAVLSSPVVEIRSWRNRAMFAYERDFGRYWTARVGYLFERRKGNRLFSQGTYNRIGTPLGDTFTVPGQEVWEPTPFLTQELMAEVDYRRGNWLAGGSYRLSSFINHSEFVIWQNPFRISPAQATQPAGALERGNFAQTQTALPPNNLANTLSFNAMVLLPRSSKLAGVVSWARWSQDEDFLPFTINTAITAPNLPPGVPPTSLQALPQRSLNGVIHTLLQDYVATTRVFTPWRLTARYNDYDLDNDTDSITFPGYSAFGDSFWRLNITGQPGTEPVPIRNEPTSFHRRRAYFESALRVFKDLTWKAAYRFERWNRENREVEVANEHGFLTSLSWAPHRNWFAQAGFRYFDRKPKFYDPGTLEPSFLRMFDQAERQRWQANFLAGVNLTPEVWVSASWFYSSDEFDKEFYGLHQVKSNNLAADVTWAASDRLNLFAGLGYDRIGYDYLAVAKTSAPYNFANTWARDTRDGAYSAHAGFAGDLHGGRWNYQLSYNMLLARTEINTVNPFPVEPSAILNAQAFPFPNVKFQRHELRLDSSYEVVRNLRFGLFWLLEPYRLNDFANDTIEAYAPGNIAPETDARRFIFMDVGPSNMTGNMVAVYVRYTLF